MTTRERPAHFQRLTTVGDVTVANVLAARLRSEGIEVRVHSAALGACVCATPAMAVAVPETIWSTLC